MVKDGVVYRYIADHLGSPRLIVNAISGEVAQQLDYDEFGMITRDTSLCFQSVIWSSVMTFCHRAARCRSPDWEGLSGLLVVVGEGGGLKRRLGPLNRDNRYLTQP